MSARSAQRTRWRRWRMGWDIAGRIRLRRKTGGQDTSSREASRGLWLLLLFLVPLPRQRRTGISDLGLAAAAGQTTTRTTDEANLFIHSYSYN